MAFRQAWYKNVPVTIANLVKQHMIKIACVNPKCTAKSFLWNELTELKSAHDLTTSKDPHGVRLVVSCMYCGTENVVWVRRSGVKETEVRRGSTREEE